jgi:hypothetical protein
MGVYSVVAIAFLIDVEARVLQQGRTALRRNQVLNASSGGADEDEAASDYNATAEELANATAEMKSGESLARSALQQPSNGLVNATAGTVSAVAAISDSDKGATFRGWYDTHNSGRGLWKWANALDAYQRHFAVWAGHGVNIAEVGVQSGGSISMWQAVLGKWCYVHGLDINPNCRQFQNARTSITIGDQADKNMWYKFFTTHPPLDLLVDDGGHEPHQMLTTFLEVFYRLQPGGSVAIEDIHGAHYVQSFFTPVANYLGHMQNRGKLHSVHVYPFLLIAQKAGKHKIPVTALNFPTTNRAVVSNFNELWDAAGKHRGGVIVLRNSQWGSFLSATSLTSFFSHFGGLHDFNMYDTPNGCRSTASTNCATTVHNSPQQAMVTGIHVYAHELYVEVAPTPPIITAVRKGNKFIKYG